ncbi:MAG: nucleotide sugar dehydrogenase [Eggerthellaceae bacterium]|nr:nucleotide sugar dehydrogenase [Eggerthellaceae bacterium]
MNIAVVGLGYVGLSLACLLSQNNRVRALDVLASKVDAINARSSYLADNFLASFLETEQLDLTASLDFRFVFDEADFIIFALPTNYDEGTNCFDTSLLETALEAAVAYNPAACMVIKSTLPIGFTKNIAARYLQSQFLFSPEFLREGYGLYDNLYPTRIVVGTADNSLALHKRAEQFSLLLEDSARYYNTRHKEDHPSIPMLLIGSSEAEAIKLFSNTYLALRISFFNELDTYAESHALDARQIVQGVGLDPRIGTYYNNPSFGYGGSCLPKDVKQLLANYYGVPQNLIEAIVAANQTRMDFIAESIAGRNPSCVGIYRLAAKEDSDNLRNSSSIEIVELLIKKGITVLVYEPLLSEESGFACELITNLEEFKKRCDLIVCNRTSPELDDAREKVYTRDLGRF